MINQFHILYILLLSRRQGYVRWSAASRWVGKVTCRSKFDSLFVRERASN